MSLRDDFIKKFDKYKDPVSKDKFIKDVLEKLGETIDADRYKGRDGAQKFAQVVQSIAVETIYGGKK